MPVIVQIMLLTIDIA